MPVEITLAKQRWCPCDRRSDGLDALQQEALASAPEGPPAATSSSLRLFGGSPLQESVGLLTACRPEELRKLEELTGPKKVLALFRCAPGVKQACVARMCDVLSRGWVRFRDISLPDVGGHHSLNIT